MAKGRKGEREKGKREKGKKGKGGKAIKGNDLFLAERKVCGLGNKK